MKSKDFSVVKEAREAAKKQLEFYDEMIRNKESISNIRVQIEKDIGPVLHLKKVKQ
jgi:hypothetical protein